jgi:hypothetical protein
MLTNYKKKKESQNRRDHRGIRSKKSKGKSKKIPEELLFPLNFYLFT